MKREIYTGKIAEYDLFGEVKEKAKRKGKWEEHEHLPRQEALDLVKEQQPWEDPTNPKKKFPMDLREEIAENLNIDLSKEEISQRLRFYTAVESELDYCYGVDGFFEFDAPDPSDPKKIKTFRVTIDLSLKEKYKYKADYLLIYPEEVIDFEEYPEEYRNIVEKSGKEISKIFLKQLKGGEGNV